MNDFLDRTFIPGGRGRGYGVVLSETQSWGVAQPGANLDYYLDARGALYAADDIINEVALSFSPYGDGELQAASLSVVDSIITVWLSGGVPGRSYRIKVQATTAGTRGLTWLISLKMDATLAATPLPTPEFEGFSTPITCSGSSSIPDQTIPPLAIQDDITATVGGQTGAVPLTGVICRFTSVPPGAGGILTAPLGQSQRIFNRCGTGQAVQIYPIAGMAIEGNAVNAPVSVADGGNATFTNLGTFVVS